MEAEQIVIDKIKKAFEVIKPISNEEIESNPYLLEEVSSEDFKKILPTLMIYELCNFREDPQSMVYIQLLSNLNELSKNKAEKSSFNAAELRAILAFLQHLLHNQPANIDEDEIQNIIKRL